VQAIPGKISCLGLTVPMPGKDVGLIMRLLWKSSGVAHRGDNSLVALSRAALREPNSAKRIKG
jgi:hypothetical protein